MTIERSAEKPERVENISVLPERLGLALEQTQRLEFQVRVVALNDAIRVRQEFALARDVLESTSRQKLTTAREDLAKAEQKLAEARAHILPSQEDIISPQRDSIIKERIRVKLSSVGWRWHELPKKFIYQLLTGGGPLRSHPYLEPYIQAKLEAEEGVKKADKEYGTVKGHGMGEQLANMDKSTASSEKEVIKFIVVKVGLSRKQTLEMLESFPQFEEILVNEYVDKRSFFDNELANFEEFLNNTPLLRWNTLNLQQKDSYLKRKCQWASQKRAPTAEELKNSVDLVKLWKTFVRRRLLVDAGLAN